MFTLQDNSTSSRDACRGKNIEKQPINHQCNVLPFLFDLQNSLGWSIDLSDETRSTIHSPFSLHLLVSCALRCISNLRMPSLFRADTTTVRPKAGVERPVAPLRRRTLPSHRDRRRNRRVDRPWSFESDTDWREEMAKLNSMSGVDRVDFVGSPSCDNATDRYFSADASTTVSVERGERRDEPTGASDVSTGNENEYLKRRPSRRSTAWLKSSWREGICQSGEQLRMLVEWVRLRAGRRQLRKVKLKYRVPLSRRNPMVNRMSEPLRMRSRRMELWDWRCRRAFSVAEWSKRWCQDRFVDSRYICEHYVEQELPICPIQPNDRNPSNQLHN